MESTTNGSSFESRWNGGEHVLSTRIAGRVTLAEVEAWRDGLLAAAEEAADNDFRMLIDICGYEVADVAPEVHKVQREVIPLFLLEHGHRTRLLELFPDAVVPEVPRRGGAIVAVAHIHHDEGKMALYDQKLGAPDERFFTERASAVAWLASV